MYGQASQNRAFYPTFNENRPPSQPHFRPQTPNPNSYSYNQTQPAPLNRTYNKLPRDNQGFAPQRNTMSRSRISLGNSQASHLSDLINEPDVFPQELVFLLRNEEKNINNVKEKIQKEKSRVENDFAVFRAEIDHVLEDVKLSVQAELDMVYKIYITKYAELKGEVQDLRMMRKQILMNSNNGQNSYGPNQPSVSNKDLINQIEKDAEHMRNFRIYGYLSELQKQKLEPIGQISNQLVIIGSSECPFYKHKELVQKLKNVKGNFGGFIKEVFQTLDQYVITPQSLIDKDRAQFQNTRTVLRQLQGSDSTKMKAFDVHYPSNSRMQEPSQNINNMNMRASKEPKRGKKLTAISSNEQGCVTKWCEEIKINRMQKVETDHKDSILCIHFVGDRYIATGSKDTTLNIYSLDGRKLRTLKGHSASICCLSTIRNHSGQILASGSDNGCGSVILWDTKSWQMLTKIQAHEAAVTSIVDLDDGQHIATGSYDKKINIFSMSRSQKLLTLDNRASVTGMVITSDKSRLITAGLDKSITVWTIIRRNGMVEGVVNEKVIPCQELVCQLQPSLLRPQLIFCAGRDGTLRVLNIISGRIDKSYTVNANSLIELVAIERQMNSDSPILISCSCKDNALVATKMDNGLSSLIKVPNGLGIDFGCGIGPKVVLSQARDGMIAILNQRKDNREFSLYELELK